MAEPTRVWMPPMAPKLEKLAKELETQPTAEAMKVIIEHVRDNDYLRYKLVRELRLAKMGYFAGKLENGYYDIFTK